MLDIMVLRVAVGDNNSNNKNNNMGRGVDANARPGVFMREGRPVSYGIKIRGHCSLAYSRGGADVWRPHPIWNVPGHACQLVPRSVYLEVTAGLEAVDAASTGDKVAIGSLGGIKGGRGAVGV